VIDLDITAAPMNPPPQTPPQVIGRRQNPNVVSTGLRLSREQSQNQEQRFLSFPITGDVAGEIKSQTDELNRFLQIQVTIFIFFILLKVLFIENDLHRKTSFKFTGKKTRIRFINGIVTSF
jgi:hypothetical protein